MPGEMIAEQNLDQGETGLSTLFAAQYERIARVIEGVTKDPARAEELAVEVFLRWSRSAKARRGNPPAWLYRTAIRLSIDELRKQARRSRLEAVFSLIRKSPSPFDAFAASEEQQRVRLALAALRKRDAELVVLRSQGLSYSELALALELNPASVGTLLSRAQGAFRKEYEKRYGPQQ